MKWDSKSKVARESRCPRATKFQKAGRRVHGKDLGLTPDSVATPSAMRGTPDSPDGFISSSFNLEAEDRDGRSMLTTFPPFDLTCTALTRSILQRSGMAWRKGG